MAQEPAEAKKSLTPREAAHIYSGLTPIERELLETFLIPDVKTVKEAAQRIGMTPNHAYQSLLRLKMRYARAKGVKEEVDYYRSKLFRQQKDWVLRD